MTLRIRQVALVARDLEPAVAQLCSLLGAEVCHRDPGVEQFGLRNALLAIGDTYLEVVSPARSGTSAERLLARRGGDGGYMVLLQTADLAADRARFEALGVRVVWESAFPDMAAVHLHPRDVGGAIVSFDQPTPPESWRWAGDGAEGKRAERALAIVGAELQATEPAALSARWAQVLGLRGQQTAEGVHAIDLVGGQLRFVPDTDARGEGLSTIVLRRTPSTPCDDVVVCGTRFRFID